jgi:hypothetical protein
MNPVESSLMESLLPLEIGMHFPNDDEDTTDD